MKQSPFVDPLFWATPGKPPRRCKSRHFWVVRIYSISEGDELIAVDSKPLRHAKAAELLARLRRNDYAILQAEAIRSDRITNPRDAKLVYTLTLAPKRVA